MSLSCQILSDFSTTFSMKFKKTRVTDDYTLEQRDEIRRWVKMAKDKNDKNTGNRD